MRSVKRWVRRLVLFAILAVGSIVGLDQWLFHRAGEAGAGERSGRRPAGAPQLGEKPEDSPRKPARKPEPGPASTRRSDTGPRDEARYGPFGSRAACERALAERSKAGGHGAKARGPRIGTWNVRWFPKGTKDGRDEGQRTDVAFLACAIAWIDVDLLALQEILDDPEGRRAALELIERLDAHTGGRHRLELDACSGSGRQHVGFLWDEARVALRDVRSIAELNPAGSMCAASLRPGLGAHARFADGRDLHVITVHLDSGDTARDFNRRAASVEALGPVLRGLRARDRDALVIGDYNTMGCARCAEAVAAGEELAQLDARLRALGLERLEPPELERCTHYYRGRPSPLDLAVVSPELGRAVAAVRVEGVCGALGCGKPPAGATPAALRSLSDHCPLIVELEAIR